MLEPQELRLECLKLALAKDGNIEEAVAGATLLLEFLQEKHCSQPYGTGGTE